MDLDTTYFVVDSLTGELDVSQTLSASDRALASRAIEELRLNDAALKMERLGVIKQLARELEATGDEAIARHVAITRGGFLTTVESYLS